MFAEKPTHGTGAHCKVHNMLLSHMFWQTGSGKRNCGKRKWKRNVKDLEKTFSSFTQNLEVLEFWLIGVCGKLPFGLKN